MGLVGTLGTFGLVLEWGQWGTSIPLGLSLKGSVGDFDTFGLVLKGIIGGF